jgi:hypothetical protein
LSKNNRFRRKNQGLLKNSAKLERRSQSIDGLFRIQPEKADARYPQSDQVMTSPGSGFDEQAQRRHATANQY